MTFARDHLSTHTCGAVEPASNSSLDPQAARRQRQKSLLRGSLLCLLVGAAFFFGGIKGQAVSVFVLLLGLLLLIAHLIGAAFTPKT